MGKPDLRPAEIRFWECVDRSAGPDGCWPWTGNLARKGGYGRFQFAAYTKRLAHRLSLEWSLGRALLPNEFACHHCDNPPCVNPAHLYAGTQLDNVRDREARQRHPHIRTADVVARQAATMRRMIAEGTYQTWKMRQTHCKRGHEFTPENTVRYKDTPRSRHCRACIALRNHRDTLSANA